MREQSNGLAGPNIAAGGGRAVSSKELLGLMRICSVPKASFPVLQERLVLSVDDFFRIPASAEGNRTAEKNHQRQPNACMNILKADNSESGAKSKRRSGSKESGANRSRIMPANSPRACALGNAHTGWPVRGARPSVRAQSRARLPAYSPLTRLLHSCTTWQWLASELCVQSTPLQYRRDSRAEVTAHRAGSAASGDP